MKSPSLAFFTPLPYRPKRGVSRKQSPGPDRSSGTLTPRLGTRSDLELLLVALLAFLLPTLLQPLTIGLRALLERFGHKLDVNLRKPIWSSTLRIGRTLSLRSTIPPERPGTQRTQVN